MANSYTFAKFVIELTTITVNSGLISGDTDILMSMFSADGLG